MIIVGSGPAGLEAALNLKIRRKKFLLFGRDNLSAKIERAPRIDNYLGLPGISGQELAERFRNHIKTMGISLRTEQISSIYPMGDYFALASNRDTYEADTVILTTGSLSGVPFPGEERLLGLGVGYCATCDAPLYRGKTVAILGWGDEAVHEANFVREIAETVYYIPMSAHSADLDPAIQVVEGTVLEIEGDAHVSSLVLEDRVLKVDGVFLLRESISPASLLPGIAMEDAFIAVDANMRTSLPGCFAAGDCTGKPHQYMRAAGQGQTAALGAVAYLDLKHAKKF